MSRSWPWFPHRFPLLQLAGRNGATLSVWFFGTFRKRRGECAAENALSLLATGELAADGVIVAREEGRLLGAMVGVALAGASGLFWLPQVSPGRDPTAVADALVRHGLAWLRAKGAKLAQVFATAEDMPFVGPLLRSGFRHITRLDYLIHELQSVPDLPNSGLKPSSLTLRVDMDMSSHTNPKRQRGCLECQPYAPHNRRVFNETLLRTYEGTLDCPELNGRRTVEEVIAGHEQQGKVRPELWWLAQEGGRPVGVVLLTELVGPEGWELSYVGVVPEARRRGVGRTLSHWALHEAKQAGIPQLRVAVDQRNHPARQLYEKMGFVHYDQREVLLFFFGDLADETPRPSSNLPT